MSKKASDGRLAVELLSFETSEVRHWSTVKVRGLAGLYSAVPNAGGHIETRKLLTMARLHPEATWLIVEQSGVLLLSVKWWNACGRRSQLRLKINPRTIANARMLLAEKAERKADRLAASARYQAKKAAKQAEKAKEADHVAA